MNPRLVRIARRLDVFWNVLARVGGSAPPTRSATVDSILVIDLHLLGDMVMLIPLLASLRARHPRARITVVAGPWSRAILAGSPAVDEIVEYVAPWVKRQPLMASIEGYFRLARTLRRRRCDLGIDVRGDVRQILLLFLARCRRRVGFDFTGGAPLLSDVVADDGELHHILGHHERIAAHLGAWDGRPFVPALSLTPQEQLDARQVAPFIGFHLGASMPLRRLPAAEAAALVSIHGSSSVRLVLFSSPDMEDYVAEVLSMLQPALRERVEVWRGDLRMFIVTLSRAVRVFTMDSGPAHIAAALGCDTVVFFGPNLPRYTGPRGSHVRFLEHPTLACRPCDQHTCTNTVHQACMRGLVSAWQHQQPDTAIDAAPTP